jgi:hypothetical protein
VPRAVAGEPRLTALSHVGAMLHEPFSVREISALVVTLGGIALAMRS